MNPIINVLFLILPEILSMNNFHLTETLSYKEIDENHETNCR